MCEHDWEPNPDIPLGEKPERYWRCRKCGVLGHVRSGILARGRRHVVVYKCRAKVGTKHCGEPATRRIPGRDDLSRLRWRCAKHA